MGKAKTQSKIDFKQFLVNRGEYLAMGIAGFFLFLLLVLGISKWTGTKDSAKIANELNQGASRVYNNIQNGTINPDDEAKTVPPKWVTEGITYQPIPMGTFALHGPVFDPIAKPDTKKENPSVLPIGTYPGAYQIDLVKAPMQGFDIIYDNEGRTKIAVISGKLVSGADKSKMKSISENLKRKGKQAGETYTRTVKTQPTGGGFGTGGTSPPDRGGGPDGEPGPGGFGLGTPPPGMFGSMSMARSRGGNPYGGMSGGGYDNTSQRIEKSIEYISIDELDRALEKGKVPAITVIPLRMVTIHAEIPYKKQLEEIRRALRIPIPPSTNEVDRKRAEEQALAEAARYARYDGYEVQRRVTRQLPGASQPQVIQDWAEYKFEDKYIELINSRKLADNIEEGYISYFLRYDMALALPLPQLVSEVTESGGYPEIRLKNINETIKKLREANKKPENPSELLARVQGGRRNLYQPVTAGQTGVSEIFGDAGTAGLTGLGATSGRGGLGGITPPTPGGGAIRPGTPGAGGGGVGGGLDTTGEPGRGNFPQAPPVEIEHLLLRFVDVDVRPGYTYEYRIRLRMLNPNYRAPEDKGPIEVANPNHAKIKELYSPWLQLAEPITVPPEAFVYAIDVASYRERMQKEYAKEKELLSRLQVKDGQVVVELCTWMEEVRTDSSNKREPVGAWVVADIPVGPGEFIGRKQYVKLPLWSSENKMYILREVPDKVIPPRGGKDVPQPKGWLVDFSTRSILVDYDGGKVTTKVGGKLITEDVASELLILRPDGKLIVKNSLQDEDDPTRKQIVSIWTKWVGEVEKRKVESSGGTGDNFSPRPPGGGGSGPPP
jgi:hypothetical protein